MADIQKVVTEAVFRDEMSAGMAAAAGAADKLNASIDRQEQTFRKAGPTAESLVKKLDAVTKAEAQLEAAAARAAREQATLQAGLATGGATSDQVARSIATHNAELARLEANLARARGAATTTATANVALAQTSKEAAWQMKQLALQTPDVVQGLLGGISPFQVLLQQGGQVVQVMGGVGNAVRGVGTMLMNAIASPSGAAVIATAVLAGFGYAAESAERRMIGLQNSLRATRDDYVALAATVNTTAKRIAATSNIGSGDAREAGVILAASPTFSGNGADLERNIKLARDLAAVMGTDLPQAATRLSAAMRDPGTEAQKLADGGFRNMSQALANSIKLQAEAGDKAGAYARVIDAMGQSVDAAGEPQTRLQKALAGINEAFTKAGQSGKSLAEEIGGAITDAASWAIEKTTAFINTLQSLRDLLPTIVPAGAGGAGAAPSFLPELPGARLFGGIRDWLSGRDPTSQRRAPGVSGDAVVGGGVQLSPSVSGYSQTVVDLARAIALKESGGQHTDARGNVKVVDAGDGTGSRVGMFQLGSQFVQDFAPGTDVMTRDGNISAALKGIDALLTWAGGDTMKAALAFRLGQAGAEAVLRGARVASPAVISYVNDVSGGDLGARVQAAREGRVRTDQAFTASRGTPIARAAELSAQRQLAESEMAVAAEKGDGATVARLSQHIQQLTRDMQALIPEQEKMARAHQETVGPMRAQEGAARDLAEIEQQFVQAARRSGTGVDQGALAQAQAAKLETLSLAFDDNVDALNRKADADARVLPLLEQGGRAAEYAANREKAVEEARKNTLPGTAARREAEEKLTAALNRGADAQIDRQAAMDVAGFAKQQEYLETELSLLTATAEKRAEELAILQERQKLGLKVGEQATVEQQKALDAAAAVARIGTELQQQKAGLEALSNGFIQIFDRVGDAITDAFVQGSASAVKWGNVVKAIGTQVLSMFLRLGVMTPLTNAVFGRNEGTLWSGLAAVSGGGQAAGAGGGGLSDLLGLGSLLGGGKSIGEALGLTGSGGMLSGIGTSIFGSNLAGPTISGAALGSPGLLGLGGTSLMGGSALTLSGAALGIGGGFAAGTLINTLLGRSENQQTNGMIGSGLGALAGFLIGGPLGGVLGGALGGGAGGMIGPKTSVKGYGYALRGNEQGLLTMTDMFYNESGDAAFKEAAAAIAAMNDYLGRVGVTISGAVGVGGNKNGPDYSHAAAGSYTEGVSKLYYGSKDPDLDYQIALQKGRKFGSPEEMQKFVDGFYAARDAVKALTAEPVPTFTAQMNAITSTFDKAIEGARAYGMAEGALQDARAKAVAELEAQRTAAITGTQDDLAIRRMVAAGDNQGADLRRQAIGATAELAALGKQLDELAVDAGTRGALMVDLEQTQAQERAAIVQAYADQTAEANRQFAEQAANALAQVTSSIDALVGQSGPAFTVQMAAINRTFDEAIAQARQYGLAEDRLTAARVNAISELEAQRAATLRSTRDGFALRRLALGGGTLETDLARQAINASSELAALGNQMDDLALSASERNAVITDAEQTLAAERADIIRQYGERAAAELRQAQEEAMQIGGNIRRYLDGLATSADAGASPSDRLTAAQAQFDRDRTLAMGGDRDALGRITGTADSLLNAGRDVYASSAGFQAIRDSVITGLSGLPVVKSYDAMQAASLAAIQTALESGTLNTAIVPTGNVVTIGGGTLALTGVESRLATMIDTLATGFTNSVTATGYVVDTLVKGLSNSVIGTGNVTDTLVTGLGAVVVGLGNVTSTLVEGFSDNNTVSGNIVATLVTGLTAANDNTVAGFAATNRILVDASAASTNSFAAMNRILVDASSAETRATVDVNTSLGTLHVALRDLNVSLGAVDASVNGAASSIRSADVNTTASLAAANRIAADSTMALVSSLAAGNTIAADSSQAIVRALVAVNEALARLEAAVRQVGGTQALEVREAGGATVDAVNRLSTVIERKAALR